tara:strand:+ start:1038 stop:1244 length:207 start_codon:yes stop_codon:yes gene_type:complete
MPKKSKSKAPVINRQLQFIGIHNSALKNLARDNTHAETIAAKIKDQAEDLSDARLEDLLNKRKELLIR